MEKLDIFTVDEELIDYYRKFDSRILYTKENRKYLGIILEIDSIKYLAPLSSPKMDDYDENGILKKDTLTILRLEDFKNQDDKDEFYHSLNELKKELKIKSHIEMKSLGKIFLANMIPVKEGTYHRFNINLEKDSKYKTLLLKQYILINEEIVKHKILKNAKIVFNHKKQNLDKGYVKACYDFIELSEKLKEF